MTYEEMVLKVRNVFENSDAREVYEHVVVQVNVTGEASGIFYIEIAERKICVEPYDYYDRDALVTIDTKDLCDIVEGRISYEEAGKINSYSIVGDPYKISLLNKIKLSNRKKTNDGGNS